jgi:hypothetical protein
MDRETYLGDGLYARFDGYQFWLRAPRSEGNHEVALEPPVLDAFLAFVKSIQSPETP